MLAYLVSIGKLQRSVLLYVAAFCSVGFGYVGVTGVLGNLYVLGMGFDPTFLGTLTVTGQFVWALTALPAGEIGARFGLRGSMKAGYALIGLCLAAYINVPVLPREVWGAGLIITNILLWASASLISVNSVPYLMTIATEGERNKAFTLQAALGALSAFLGSLVGGFLPVFLMNVTKGGLGRLDAYRLTQGVPVLLYFVAVGLIASARSAPPLVQSANETGRTGAPIGLMVLLGSMFILQYASEGSLMTYLNVYFSKDLLVSVSLIGSIFAVVRLLPFFISPLLPLALNRWGSGFVMTCCYVVISVSALGMAFLGQWVAASAAFILASMASSFAVPSRSLFGQEAVQPRWRTMINAVLTISMALGFGLSGYAGGWLIELTGFRGLFLVSATLAVAGVLMYQVSGRRKAGKEVAALQDLQS